MLKTLNNGEIDLSCLEIGDVLDIGTMSTFLDHFSLAMGMGCGVVDLKGNMLDNGHNFAEFCMDQTRATKTGLERCDVCSMEGGATATRTGKPYVYKCHAGLYDFAVPILVGGRQIGSVIGGQIVTETPDEAQFRQTARGIGADETAFLKALEKVAVVSRKKIDAAAELLFIVTNSLCNQGYEQLKLRTMLQALAENFGNISASMQQLSASSGDVSGNQSVLNGEIGGIKQLSEEINSILRSIERIAKETKILGINASIEAARAGTFGKGFGVVAQEISSLSDSSKETTQKIAELTARIQQSVEKTIATSNATLETAKQQSAAIEAVNVSLQKLTAMAEEMNRNFMI